MKKIFLILFLGLLPLLNAAPTDAEIDDGVLILTDSNFESELAKHDFMLVEFFTPWWYIIIYLFYL